MDNMYDDDAEDDDDEEEDAEDGDTFAAWQTELRERQVALEERNFDTQQRWYHADFQQLPRIGMPDWVRRVSVGRWPLAACGTATGDIYVVNCDSGAILGKGSTARDQNSYLEDEDTDTDDDAALSTTLTQLYGKYDGGGTLAIAVSSAWKTIIAHAGRTGGVELWKMATQDDNDTDDDDETEEEDYREEQEFKELYSLGTLLEEVLVTCLAWADDDLWIGTQDGRVLVYTIDDDIDDDDNETSSLLPSAPTYEFNSREGTILSLQIHEELNVVVVTTSSGVVELFNMDKIEEEAPADDPFYRRRQSFYPPFDSGRKSSNVFPLCATIVEEIEDDNDDDNDDTDNDNDDNNDESQRVGYVGASQGLKNKQKSSTQNNKRRKFSIACGGNDGSIFLQRLRLAGQGGTGIGSTSSYSLLEPEINWDHPLSKESVRELMPSHQGPCKCIVSPFPGLLLSGGQDGYVRVWDLTKKHERITITSNQQDNNDDDDDDDNPSMWALGGLKVWFGSLCVNESAAYLVMDGADNAISILNFGEKKSREIM